jgi:uncharacterized protein (DUF39 family)
MKTRKIAYIILSISLLFGCNEDDQKKASVVGRWKGTLAEVQLKPLGLPAPVTRKDENFASEIEFTSDGKVTYYQGGQPVEATYEIVDNKLVTDINISTPVIDLSGTYTIQELTESVLVFYLEKNDTVTDPGTGLSVTGDIKATLHFVRL